jgi:hypothetical protein
MKLTGTLIQLKIVIENREDGVGMAEVEDLIAEEKA